MEDKENLINKSPGSSPKHALPETEPLWYMAQSKQHIHLLKHPVITSFLWYKWQRIRRYFNRNLRFYILFVFCLTWYIFRHFGASTKTEGSQTTETSLKTEVSDLLWYSLYILLATSMGFFILKDWVNDLQDHKRNQMARNAANIEESCCFRLTRVFISNWVELVFLAVLVLLLLPSPSLLKIVLTILLVLFVLRELLQITV